MKAKTLLLAGLLVGGLGTVPFQPVDAKYDEPKYSVIMQDHNFEVRQYVPSLYALVEVPAVGRDGASEAFKILGAYIFGQNKSVARAPGTTNSGKGDAKTDAKTDSKPDSKTDFKTDSKLDTKTDFKAEASTARTDSAKPLTNAWGGAPWVTNEKIPMTVPVMIEDTVHRLAKTVPEAELKSDNKRLKMRFYLPQKYTLDNVPAPLDKRIHFEAASAKRYAVIRYSGYCQGPNLDEHVEKLRQFVKSHKLEPDGEPLVAYYNPPWTLPFFRRNEVWIPLAN